MPMMAFIGVRISLLMRARNSLLAPLAAPATPPAGAAQVHGNDGQLRGELSAVGTLGRRLLAAAQPGRLPRRQKTLQAGTVMEAQLRRHNQVRQRLADRRAARGAKRVLGRRIEFDD